MRVREGACQRLEEQSCFLRDAAPPALAGLTCSYPPATSLATPKAAHNSMARKGERCLAFSMCSNIYKLQEKGALSNLLHYSVSSAMSRYLCCLWQFLLDIDGVNDGIYTHYAFAINVIYLRMNIWTCHNFLLVDVNS